jgi:putative ABC transport system ATP-binding protein
VTRERARAKAISWVTVPGGATITGPVLGDSLAAEILRLLARLRTERGLTVILATHDPQVAAQCDRLIRLRDGAVIDDIALSGGYPADEVLRRVGQLG